MGALLEVEGLGFRFSVQSSGFRVQKGRTFRFKLRDLRTLSAQQFQRPRRGAYPELRGSMPTTENASQKKEGHS